MNFFQYQEQARRNTTRLVFLFGLALAGIVTATYLAVALTWIYFGHDGRNRALTDNASVWDPLLFCIVLAGVLAVVGIGTLIKLRQLRGGGWAVAASVGGRLIDAESATGNDRKVLNVVEEMAIASGTPVPLVFVLDDEEGINALAAGYTPQDAVVAVTRGCLEHLTRDELQGVIAHEFSHILNGDMRLNTRLIGWIHGIMAIGLIGMILVRAAAGGSGHRSGRSRNRKGPPIQLILLGLALIVIGYVGTFFGNLIRAAVSRQREFLADASSVQFTRNPLGLGGALKKIGGFVRGSRIENPAAAPLSHMFFSQGTSSWLNSLLATHPPLTQRIRRVEPAWDGQYVKVALRKPEPAPAAPVAAQPAGLASPVAPQVAGPTPVEWAMIAGAAGLAGSPNPAQLDGAARLIEELPPAVRAAAREPFAARAVVYAMLLNDDAEARAKQTACLHEGSWSGAARETERLLRDVRTMGDRCRLPALDLAVPALRQLSPSQYREFRENVEALVRADDRLQLFEWMVRQLVGRYLDPQFREAPQPRVQYYGLARLGRPCSILLSTLAHMGQREPAAVQAAFDAGAARLRTAKGPSLEPLEAKECNYESLEAALDELNQVAPRLKQSLVEACLATVLTDGCVTLREAELMRGILAILGCPVGQVDAGDRGR